MNEELLARIESLLASEAPLLWALRTLLALTVVLATTLAVAAAFRFRPSTRDMVLRCGLVGALAAPAFGFLVDGSVPASWRAWILGPRPVAELTIDPALADCELVAPASQPDAFTGFRFSSRDEPASTGASTGVLGRGSGSPVAEESATHGLAVSRVETAIVAEETNAARPRESLPSVPLGPRVSPEVVSKEIALEHPQRLDEIASAPARVAGSTPAMLSPSERRESPFRTTTVSSTNLAIEAVGTRGLETVAWRTILFATWSLGSLLLLLRFLSGFIHARRLAASGRATAHPGLHRAWLAARARLDLRDDELVQICVSEKTPGPIAIGLLRPRVLIPPSLLERLDEDALAEILVHELAHVSRRDAWIACVMRGLEITFWVHPLVHVFARSLAQVREEACDDRVLAATRPSRYARTLLAVAECCRGAPPLPGLGMTSRRGPLEARILGLLDRRRVPMTRTRPFLVALALFVALAAAAGTAFFSEAVLADEPEPNASDPVLPSDAPHRVHRVRRGDRLWDLAERYLGSGERWIEIVQANPRLLARKLLDAGDELRIPSATESLPRPALAPVDPPSPIAPRPVLAPVDPASPGALIPVDPASPGALIPVAPVSPGSPGVPGAPPRALPPDPTTYPSGGSGNPFARADTGDTGAPRLSTSSDAFSGAPVARATTRSQGTPYEKDAIERKPAGGYSRNATRAREAISPPGAAEGSGLDDLLGTPGAGTRPAARGGKRSANPLFDPRRAATEPGASIGGTSAESGAGWPGSPGVSSFGGAPLPAEGNAASGFAPESAASTPKRGRRGRVDRNASAAPTDSYDGELAGLPSAGSASSGPAPAASDFFGSTRAPGGLSEGLLEGGNDPGVGATDSFGEFPVPLTTGDEFASGAALEAGSPAEEAIEFGVDLGGEGTARVAPRGRRGSGAIAADDAFAEEGLAPTAPRVVRPGDTLRVQIFPRIPDIDTDRDFEVEPEGTLPLSAFTGRISVAGRRVAEIEKAIENSLRGQVAGARVLVSIVPRPRAQPVLSSGPSRPDAPGRDAESRENLVQLLTAVADTDAAIERARVAIASAQREVALAESGVADGVAAEGKLRVAAVELDSAERKKRLLRQLVESERLRVEARVRQLEGERQRIEAGVAAGSVESVKLEIEAAQGLRVMLGRLAE